MYIAYMRPQEVADPNYYTAYDSKGGEYRPTWLIRTSDWQKVPGHEASNGYHTLSYCWEQSGEKRQQENGEYTLIDDGHHRIFETGKEWRYFQNQYLQQIAATYEVTYDQLLQQVCLDFNIEYLWYDKTCIDQTNKAEKQREIKQMHLIYSNARYTVALVPEVHIDDPEDLNRQHWTGVYTIAKDKALQQMEKSLWWKRSWTLEEVMMSTRILIVGRNTHFWSLAYANQGDKIKDDDVLSGGMLGFKERKAKSVNQVLRHAHFRTSTKGHDKIYALANIFADIVYIEIDYDSDLSTVTNEFYRLLAEKDLSVMCFGTNVVSSRRAPYATTMGSYNLPSWTGVTGLHSSQPIADITLDHNWDYTIDDNMHLRIKCRSYTIRPRKYNDYDAYTTDTRGKKANKNYFKVITSMDDFNSDESEALEWSQWCIARATGCSPTHYHKPDDSVPFLSPIFPLSLTEECDECVILGIVFDSVLPMLTFDGVNAGYKHHYIMPVAKKSTDGFSYLIIGTVLVKHFQYDEPRRSPQDIMDIMFNNLECEVQEFCIK